MLSLLPLLLRGYFLCNCLIVGVGTALTPLETQPDVDHNSFIIAFLFGAVPVLRLLRVLRRFQKFHLLLRAFTLAFEALPVMLYLYVIMLSSLAVLIYATEPPDNIPTLR